jgi:hypothetical protein
MTCNCEEIHEGCACEEECDQQAEEMKPVKNNHTCRCKECLNEDDSDYDFLSNGDLIY